MGKIGDITAQGAAEVTVVIKSRINKLPPDTALLDTGFSGFVLIPPSDADKLGFIEEDRSVMYLADGKRVNVLYAEGEVGVGGRVYGGLIGWLENSSDTDIIIGREVLQQARVIIDYDAMEARAPQI